MSLIKNLIVLAINRIKINKANFFKLSQIIELTLVYEETKLFDSLLKRLFRHMNEIKSRFRHKPKSPKNIILIL
ncbi:hypothetical protein BpHYR1_044726 [Brachionus plicatilis]|uniref:Uncharacterized protein n=1 Tax=Brachionus plicatilis TaxID=10195 RepID=A0A3M7QST8_BRAPC|nr:hypothetical protein BpHYR1_044726 [Brachionus plicatilis]